MTSPIAGLDRVGLLGGGVIGGGWAARFVLNGVDVDLYDPDPDAARKVGEVLDNARRAADQLTDVTRPTEGTLQFVATPDDDLDHSELRSVDTTTGRMRWSRPIGRWQAHAFVGGHVIAWADDRIEILAPANGQVVASLS